MSTTVQHFRQNLLWPLRLMPISGSHGRPWQLLRDLPNSPWRELMDEYTGKRDGFHERHYHEFVAFLPYVQRFLYGDGRTQRTLNKDETDPPMRTFRRNDIKALRVQVNSGDAPITLDVHHVDLYFFFDVDLVLLNIEVSTNNIPLAMAEELLYRLGRAYPAGWDENGNALHSLNHVEWLDAQGNVLSEDDAKERETFLSHVCEHRVPRMTAHWGYILQPLVNDHTTDAGVLRYRQIEHYRIPVMGFLAVDNPNELSRSDFIRLGLVTGAASDDELPFAAAHLNDFENRYCDDRFWHAGGAAPYTRYLCSGYAMIVVGDANKPFFNCPDRGVRAQFNHQHFLLFLIAHFQKATLLMFSDRLVEALKKLDVNNPSSVRRFKRSIRASFEGFLRFTHRYWFHEIAEQPHMRSMFHLCAQHLGLDPLYNEVKERITDMNAYLDADGLRRQANTVVRLTVVTIFGLIGTITTGFLGMNILNEADAPLYKKLALFATVFGLTIMLTIYTMTKSKKLSDFLDAVSDERLNWWQKTKALIAVWRNNND